MPLALSYLSNLAPAGQSACLLHPSGKLSFVEWVILVDAEVAHPRAWTRRGGFDQVTCPQKKATLTYFVKQ